MDGTRAERRRPAQPAKPRITEPIPVNDARTRLKAPAAPGRGLCPEERVALIAHSLKREAAAALLEGFAPGPRQRAQAFLAALASKSSSERQGRLASEFGVRPDSAERLRAVWAGAGLPLRRELYALLPTFHRSLFPDFVAPPPHPEAPEAPCLKAFAERLVREATR